MQGPRGAASPREAGVLGGMQGPRGVRSTHGRRRFSRRVRQQGRLPKRLTGRLAVIDRAVSRASTCGNCASSGHLPAADAGRAACGTAPSSCRGASGPHWPSPRRAISGHGRSSPAWTPDRRRWSASPGRSRSGLSGRRRRTGPAGRRTVPSIGARPPPPRPRPPGWAGMGRIKPWPCHEGDGERRAGID
jgi:hypothetical protein